MKLRIAIALAVTLIICRVFYGWRLFTFMVWTNAAIINHAHPLLTVATIELFLAGLLFAGIFVLIGLLK